MSILVPPSVEITTYDDDALVGFQVEMKDRLRECAKQLDDATDPERREKIRRAMSHYDRGQRVAGEVLRARHGGPMISYGPARPVHNFVTGYHTLKAVNRLMGLCEVLYDVVGAFLDDDTDENHDRLIEAHETLKKALAAGGVE